MPVVRRQGSSRSCIQASAIARRNLELAKEIADRDYHDLLVISILEGLLHLRRRPDPRHARRRAFRRRWSSSSYPATATARPAARSGCSANRQRGGGPRRAADRRHPRIRQDAEIRQGTDAVARRQEAISIAVLLDKYMRRAYPSSTPIITGFDCPVLFQRRLRHGRRACLPRTTLRRRGQGRRVGFFTSGPCKEKVAWRRSSPYAASGSGGGGERCTEGPVRASADAAQS